MGKICDMCYNARLDDELTDDNDYSARSIGDSDSNYRMMLCAGNGKPLRIEIEKWVFAAGWCNIGRYFPKYCPECGRKIIEYEK